MSGEVYFATIRSRYVHGSHKSLSVGLFTQVSAMTVTFGRPRCMMDVRLALSFWVVWPSYSDFPA